MASRAGSRRSPVAVGSSTEVILKGPPFAPPQVKALIDKFFGRGCSCGHAIGVGEIVRRLRPKRACGLRSKHGAVGIVYEGEPVVAIQGIEIYPLEDGYLVLIDRKTNFAFLSEVVRLGNTHLGKEGAV